MVKEFSLQSKGQDYQVKFVGEPDNVLYTIYQGETYLFTIGLNEYGEWESAEKADEGLVKELGNLICDKFY